jgi:hypothetical protein
MIYTCYDMMRDCRAGRVEGWSHFISHYVPVIRKIEAHYYPDQAGNENRLGQVLQALRRSLFHSLEPAPERWFVAELRQRVLAAFEASSAGGLAAGDLDLEVLGKALEPFTVLEKQATWLETMRYPAEHAAVLLRMDRRTVEKIREKAADRLRGQIDNWSRSMLAENGAQLGHAAAAAGTPDCLPPKSFLDVLDGRTTWRGREELEGHVAGCWHCIDHFCRLAEVLDLVRGITPLPESEAEPLLAAIGIAGTKEGGWRRWFRGR